jgi:hypothetical protein
MHRVVSCVLIFVVCSANLAGAQRADPGPVAWREVAALLPVGSWSADVMEVVAPPRLLELSQRFQSAARQDSAWFTAYIKTAPSGQPLPYHPRLGLTAGEYREFLALGDSMRMRPADRATLHVTRTPKGWRIETDSSLFDVRVIEIDTVTGLVQTPMRMAGGATRVVAGARQQTTGPWDGVQWRREEMSRFPETGSTVTFALGRLRDSGRILLYYDARRIDNGALTGRATRILTFDEGR